MLDTTAVSKRKWYRVLLVVCSFILLPIFVNSICDSSLLPPAKLSHPTFLKASIVTRYYQRNYKEFIKLIWENPQTDSLSIYKIGIIRTIPINDSITDTLFSTIDGAKTEVYQPTDNLLSRNSVKTIYYRIFAIDSLDRCGDTSAICSLHVAPLVQLDRPLNTFESDTFEWTVLNNFGAWYSTDMTLWKANDSTPIWKSDSSQLFGRSMNQDKFIRILSLNNISLEKGEYVWAVRYELFLSSQNPKSYTFGTFNVN